MKEEKRKRLRRDEDELTQDREAVIYNNGVQDGLKHQTPSKETIEKIEKVKLDVNTIQVTMETINKNFEELKKENKESHDSIINTLKETLDKKADKVIVDELKENQNKVIWMIVTAFVISIIGLIMKI